MSNKIYYSPTALTGGAANALDYIDGADDGEGHALADGDVAHVMVAGVLYQYRLNATSGATESSPSIIKPDTNGGDKRWILQRTFTNIQQLLDNISFTATVSAKALTVALKGVNGNDPASGNPCMIAFRSATLTDGKPVVRSVTSSLSVVLSSGSTLGFTAALAGRLYVWAIDNAGTVELALSRTADIFPESNLVSTTAEGGAGAADSASVMYSTTARTNVACRCIGYIEITTGATAGEWDNAPTVVQVMGPGVHRTGDIVQTRTNSFVALTGCATTMPYDDTIPQITEGNEVLTVTIIPTSAINRLHIDANVLAATSTANQGASVALFQDSTAGALAVAGSTVVAAYVADISLHHDRLAGTTSSTVFRLRAGGHTNTLYINGYDASHRLYGERASTTLTVKEVFE